MAIRETKKMLVLTIRVPVRGFTAKGANAIKDKLLEKLPQLGIERQIENLRITTVFTDHNPTPQYRFGTLIGIQSMAMVHPEQFTLLKADIEGYLDSLRNYYPKMQQPEVEVD